MAPLSISRPFVGANLPYIKTLSPNSAYNSGLIKTITRNSNQPDADHTMWGEIWNCFAQQVTFLL
ncbi:hypothetical protein [Grimontia marina]|uniref:hypothetical protein n=1 Tax=Grimontia marina TaxID=646534 RepID=UPI0012FBD7B9|nr:hypothetical protein [Grimontia marina]